MNRNSETQTICHCGDDFADYQKIQMRRDVCKSLATSYRKDGKAYCVFHFPDKQKSLDFKEAFANKIAKRDYFFYGTWFPDPINFSTHNFQNWADFASTTFIDEVSFADATFNANCQFFCAKFKKGVSFSGSVFCANLEVALPTNFYSAAFEDVADFSRVTFKTDVDFSSTKFLLKTATASENWLVLSPLTTFAYATFERIANFDSATFGNAVTAQEILGSVSFTEANFQSLANFEGCDFFTHTGFNQTVFKGTADFRNTHVDASLSFEGASFEGYAKFSGKSRNHKSWSRKAINFKAVDIEKAEKISFQTVQLDPEAFLNTDIRKFDLTDIDWDIKSFAYDWSRSKDILVWTARVKEAKSNYHLVEVAYRRAAANAEESNQYRDASDLRYAAFEIQRINRWYGRLPITLLWWYKWTSRYGESWWWTAFVLTLLLGGSAYAFTRLPFFVCPSNQPVAQSTAAGLCTIRPLDRYEAIRHSLANATFQNIDHRRPISENGEMAMLAEKILAPIQAALLALAIRRKVMR